MCRCFITERALSRLPAPWSLDLSLLTITLGLSRAANHPRLPFAQSYRSDSTSLAIMAPGGLCLLCFDGGGVRGLSSLYILRNLMDKLQDLDPNATELPKPCDVFDMIGGTSTGGLIAVMLGRLKMSVDECIAAYIKLSSQIFAPEDRKWL